MEVKLSKIKELNEEFDSCRGNRVAQCAAMTSGIDKAAYNKSIEGEEPASFSITLKQGDITNQKQSGRCWMFAALNTFRYRIINKLNLKTFELSQSYPLFYDKLEKSNYFLNSILKTLDEEQDSRLMAHLLKDPLGDGGQWDMFVNLVKKYGVVPKDIMPESANSSCTRFMDEYLTKLLRNDACKLRTAHKEGSSMEDLEKMVEDFMVEIHRALCISLGTPPEKFNFAVYDKDDNYIGEKDLTPVEFFNKYVDLDLDEYISIINAPTKDKPYNETYTVDFLGNVVEGKLVKYINLPIDELKKAAINQLKAGEPVWFGCDVGQFFSRDGYVLDMNAMKVDDLFNVSFPMNKEQRLDYGESLMTHAMVFMGVDLDENGNPLKWRVENSWGKDAGKDGYLVMTDEWFDEYMYQVAINKKYLSEDILKNWVKEPKHLKPWDPMGSLAR